MTQLIRSAHTDSRGIAFAGQILAWMDIAGGVAARRHSGRTCLTAAVDAVHFLAPVKMGQICIIKASVNRTWTSSMEVIVNVEAEDMKSGIVTFCCHGFITFVISKEYKLPPVNPTTMRERRRYHDAQERRVARLARKQAPVSPCYPTNPQLDGEDGEDDRFRSNRANSFTESRPRLHSTFPNKEKQLVHVTCSETYTEVTEIIFPEHCNSLGITFGGQVLKFMEFAATIAANRCSRAHMLIASVDSISFLHSTQKGDVIIIRAMVSASFKHSIEVYCTVEKESDGTTVVTNDGWFTCVAVDEKGGALIVPIVKAVSQVEQERERFASQRREKRLHDKAMIKTYLK